MLLYLMRHGIAIDREDPGCPPEAERFLTSEGVQKTREVARGLAAMGIDPDDFLSSPLVRAVQTAEIVAAELKFSREKIQRTDALKYPMRPAEFFKGVAETRSDEVICFGHAPPLDEMIAHAVGAPGVFTALKKSGVVCLQMDSFRPIRGSLLWLMHPKALRRLAG